MFVDQAVDIGATEAVVGTRYVGTDLSAGNFAAVPYDVDGGCS